MSRANLLFLLSIVVMVVLFSPSLDVQEVSANAGYAEYIPPYTMLPKAVESGCNWFEGRNGTIVFGWEDQTERVEYRLSTVTQDDQDLGPLDLLEVAFGDNEPLVFYPIHGSKLVAIDSDGKELLIELKHLCAIAEFDDSVLLSYMVDSVKVDVEIWIEARTLVFNIRSDSPVLEIDLGHYMGPDAYSISFPYMNYTGIAVIGDSQECAFLSTFFDWGRSNATAIDGHGVTDRAGTKVVYAQTAYWHRDTSGHIHTPEARFYVTVSTDVRNVFPSVPNAPSENIDDLKDRVVLDSWIGSFYQTRKLLEILYDYGLRDLLFIQHSWQQWGYDVALPFVYPAGMKCGGHDLFVELAKTAHEFAYRFGVHTNYSDFSYVDLLRRRYGYEDKYATLDSMGKQKVWNEWVAMKPSCIMQFAGEIEPQIHSSYLTSASYSDVVGGHPPQGCVDYDHEAISSTSMREVMFYHKQLSDFMKELHQGPVITEGNRAHLYYSGLFDGYQAEIWDWEGKHNSNWSGHATSFLLDFPLFQLRSHSVGQGMGYLVRFFFDRPNSILKLMGQDYDIIRALQIAYGNAGFVTPRLWSGTLEHDLHEYSVVEIVREYYSMKEIQKRYIGQQVEEVMYANPGTALLPTSQAIFEGLDFTIGRVRFMVTYVNGLQVYSNLSDGNWTVKTQKGSIVIPQYGWFVTGEDDSFIALSALVDDKRIDYVRGDEYIYVNSRDGVNAYEGIETDGHVAIAPKRDGQRDTTSLFVIEPCEKLVISSWVTGFDVGELLKLTRFNSKGEQVAEETILLSEQLDLSDRVDGVQLVVIEHDNQLL